MIKITCLGNEKGPLDKGSEPFNLTSSVSLVWARTPHHAGHKDQVRKGGAEGRQGIIIRLRAHRLLHRVSVTRDTF